MKMNGQWFANFLQRLAMRIRDIMTRDVVSCAKDLNIAAAARLMLDGRFGTLPIVDENGKLIGIVTDRDIAMAAAMLDRNASQIFVHEAMTEQVRSCFADDDIRGALKQMEEARVRRLPVIDGAGHLVGILSVDDIVRRALDRRGGVSSAVFVNVIAAICSRPPIEPDVDYSDEYVSG
jgi:CBS domain-containing protein